jgi:TPR repeat protein
MRYWISVLVLALQLPNVAVAGDKVHWRDRAVMSDFVYLHYHPDQLYRGLGIQAFARGDYTLAMEHFKHAAHYADKASQAFIAGMYWEGRGVARDPAVAYAWMDLAGERGSRPLLAYREQYWSQLSEVERAQAITIGADLYADYGDDVAQRRLENVMSRGRSRAAATHSPYLYVNGYVNWYEPKFWRPKQYWAWQEVLIREAMPRIGDPGSVEVGPAVPIPRQRKGDSSRP